MYWIWNYKSMILKFTNSNLSVCGGRLCSQSQKKAFKKRKQKGKKKVKTLRRKVVRFSLWADIRSLPSPCVNSESETCSAWLTSLSREAHLTLEIERLARGRILPIKATSPTTIRTKMRRIQTLPRVRWTVRSLRWVRHNETVLMQDKSLPTILFIQIQTFPNRINKGRESTLMGTFIHRK